MATLIEIRQSIWNRINEIEEISKDKNKFFDKDYNCTDIDGYLNLCKKINYKRGWVVRKIKELWSKVYNGPMPTYNYDYCDYLADFRRFLN